MINDTRHSFFNSSINYLVIQLQQHVRNRAYHAHVGAESNFVPNKWVDITFSCDWTNDKIMEFSALIGPMDKSSILIFGRQLCVKSKVSKEKIEKFLRRRVFNAIKKVTRVTNIYSLKKIENIELF